MTHQTPSISLTSSNSAPFSTLWNSSFSPQTIYPAKFITSLRLSECKRLTRTRVHRFLRRRFLYLKKRGNEKPCWQICFDGTEIKNFKITLKDIPCAFLVTNAVIIGDKHFRILNNGIKFSEGKLRWCISASDSFEDLKPDVYPMGKFEIPFELCHIITITNINECKGAYAIMFSFSKQIHEQLVETVSAAIGGSSRFVPALNPDGFYTMVFEMPNNYNAGDYNMCHFTTTIDFSRKLLDKRSFTYHEKDAAYFNAIIKPAQVYLKKTYNVFGSSIYVFKTITDYALPPIKIIDEYEPDLKEEILVTLPHQTLVFNKIDFTFLMGNSLSPKFIDFCLYELWCKLPAASRYRVAVVYTREMEGVSQATAECDDFFQKEIVVIPLFYRCFWLTVIVTNPSALITNLRDSECVSTAVMISTPLPVKIKRRIFALVISFIQRRFDNLKNNKKYPPSMNCDTKKIILRSARLVSPRKGFDDSGTYILQLVEDLLEHLPEPSTELRLMYLLNPTNYMTPFGYRISIRYAISNRATCKPPNVQQNFYHLPSSTDTKTLDNQSNLGLVLFASLADKDNCC